MKRLTKFTIVALFAVTSVFSAQPVQNTNMQNASRYGMPGRMVKARLNLTEEQEKKFDEIMFSQREAAIDTRAEIQKVRLEMQKISASENPDLNKMKKLNAKISELQTQLGNRRLETWDKINKILTPEQKKTWSNMLTRFAVRKGSPRKMRGTCGKRFNGRRGMMR